MTITNTEIIALIEIQKLTIDMFERNYLEGAGPPNPQVLEATRSIANEIQDELNKKYGLEACRICYWTYDRFEGVWETSCGKEYSISSGTPKKNDMLYCPFCGSEIREITGGPPS